MEVVSTQRVERDFAVLVSHLSAQGVDVDEKSLGHFILRVFVHGASRFVDRFWTGGYSNSAIIAAALAAPLVSTSRTDVGRPISSAMIAATWSGSKSP